ncbi:MAG: helix-turn-helix transcriptional regulator [Pseudomonadales bacterium]|nr:helix-turn-helix transcriptional regulator [Pseudomonadales bacterium]
MAKKLSPSDWFRAAEDMLKEAGPQAVAIRELSTALGVSTGSFYHHFRGREDFVERFLDHWAEVSAEAASALDGGETATLDALNERVNELLDHRLEASIRAWGLFDPNVQSRLEVVDERRRKVLARLYRDHASAEVAEQLANLHLCSLAGAQFVFMNRPVKFRQFGRFVNQCARTVVG